MLIIIQPQNHVIENNSIKRSCILTRVNKDKTEETTELWFTFSNKVSPPHENDCDAYLLATFMEAIRENRSIEVRGSVSKELLSNLVEYQYAWNKWLPDIYNIIDIKCDEVREYEQKKPGTICAFSGGVDATFSVWRHTQSKVSYRSQNISMCAIVHGFDIPIQENEQFEKAQSACSINSSEY